MADVMEGAALSCGSQLLSNPNTSSTCSAGGQAHGYGVGEGQESALGVKGRAGAVSGFGVRGECEG